MDDRRNDVIAETVAYRAGPGALTIDETVCSHAFARLHASILSSLKRKLPVRQIFFAALLCAAAVTVAPSVEARGLTTAPNVDGAMLIPTYATPTAQVIPVYYRRYHRRYYRRHYPRYYRR